MGDATGDTKKTHWQCVRQAIGAGDAARVSTTGCWCKGNTAVSKTADGGSSPSHPAHGHHRSGGTDEPTTLKDMKTLSYCVFGGTLLFLCLNGGENANITAWALSLCGIVTALVLLLKESKKDW